MQPVSTSAAQSITAGSQAVNIRVTQTTQVHIPAEVRSAEPLTRVQPPTADSTQLTGPARTAAPNQPTLPLPATTTLDPAPPASTQIELGQGENMCTVCVENPVSSVFTPCGHLSACFDCANEWIERQKARLRISGRNEEDARCPVCREETHVIKTYAV